jgi:hypothetical protein
MHYNAVRMEAARLTEVIGVLRPNDDLDAGDAPVHVVPALIGQGDAASCRRKRDCIGATPAVDVFQKLGEKEHVIAISAVQEILT